MRSCVLVQVFLWNLVNDPHRIDVPPTYHRSKRNESGLPRIDPVKDGHVTELLLVSGKLHHMVTKATKPPVFEIDDFLSPEECEDIIKFAKKEGLKKSETFGKGGNITERGRESNTVFVSRDSNPIFKPIQQRLSDLTGISLDLLYQSEPYQIVHYELQGYYHSHYDVSDLQGRPCCHNVNQTHAGATCGVCRYVTVIMYLNTVEEGGGTAFPIADDPTIPAGGIYPKEKIDLSQYCNHANLIVYPKKGRAVMWYNFHRDDENGWLGNYDKYALHGGCDVIKGEKWIFTSWINASPYADRFKKSVYELPQTLYK